MQAPLWQLIPRFADMFANFCPRHFWTWLAISLISGWLPISSLAAEDLPLWIWSPAQDNEIPAGTCYFRKTFELAQPESADIQITADNAYELFVNGRSVGKGDKWQLLDTYDISKYLIKGRNCVAVKVENTDTPSAGLVAQVLVKEVGGTFVAYASDKTWKTSLKEQAQWQKIFTEDREWLPARELGQFGKTKPWFDEVQLAGGGLASRFRTQPDFAVEQILAAEQTGSVITLAFNEFGEILVSREGGGLLIVRDNDQDGRPETAKSYCDQVQNCQGILPLNGQVYVIGGGSDGPGLYRLTDADTDGQAEKADLLLKFKGEMGEHGPHALTLGPDGLIYIMVGNHSSAEKAVEPGSPYRHFYEGDLLPKYEDPRGHGVGIKAPGGHVLRTDTEASFLEMYAGGFRNAYDLAFLRNGDLLTYDSDMEWDTGTPWYRPTRVLQVVPGGEYGWRSGWSVWPEYQYDSLPAVAETGRGSPTGMTVYEHHMYPRRYHNAVFLGDWARGRIVCLRLKPHNGSYTIEGETFVEGRPLNITDVAVGPDGWLYFSTGGRATDGGVYRVVWQGKVPPSVTDLGTGLTAALRQPQLSSAYARQQCALIQQQLGEEWNAKLPALAGNAAAKVDDRLRALELMQLLGPFPTPDLLAKLTDDSSERIRAKTAFLLGIHADETLLPRLLKLLRDSDPVVQRTACEALLRSEARVPAKELIPLLNSSVPQVAWQATRLLESLPPEQWRGAIMEHATPRVYLQGALALVRGHANPANCQAILEKNLTLLQGYLSDADFLALLRLTELALIHGKLSGETLPGLRIKLADEYPTKDARMNRELVRLLAFLREPRATELFLDQLRGAAPAEEKLHLALHARFLTEWTTSQKLELLAYLEYARTLEGGHSYAGYIENVSRDFFLNLTAAERTMLLRDGTKWPASALSVLAKLPPQPTPETIEQIIALDRRLPSVTGEAAKKLAVGIVAVLGRSGDAVSQEYLREVYQRDPGRRGYIAMALAQQPAGKNWPILVQSLTVVDGIFAQEVLAKLATVSQRPDQPEALRQVILRGLKLGEAGGRPAILLLEKWTGEKLGSTSDKVLPTLALWQAWFSKKYPLEPPPTLPVVDAHARWTAEELLVFLNSAEAAAADPAIGAQVFVTAKCAACHRFGTVGEGIGPDLSAVSRRFHNKEILESILHPSQVISDQYASKTLELTDGRTVAGLVAPQPDGSVVVLTSQGEKVTLEKTQIAETLPSRASAMPEGLLNELSLEEIAALFAYLHQPQDQLSSRRGVAPVK
ncbi:MAG: HEAT repeat domain-containing protein [Pirellulales bacterium]|nr:HEAT repeat domain-containing protein [Pirellulales bacterium]